VTRAELHRLVDRLPEDVLDDGSRRLVVDAKDLSELTAVLIELVNAMRELTREWVARGWPGF
jgi:hypothetical protein